MKIIPTSPITGVEQYTKIKQKQIVDKTHELGKDEISVSDDATLFADALRMAKQDLNDRLINSDIDIVDIRGKIANGSYEVDKDELASSIMMLQGYYERR